MGRDQGITGLVCVPVCVCLFSCVCVCVFLCVCTCVDSLVEFQVQDEGSAKGLYQETALGQMDRLRVGWRERGGRREEDGEK